MSNTTTQENKMANKLFARTEEMNGTHKVTLCYTEDGEYSVVKVYRDSINEAFSVMDEALENARMDGFKIDWK